MEQQIIDLASKGTGWVIAVYLFFKFIAEKDKRLSDIKESRDEIIEPQKNMQKSLDVILGILVKAGK